MAPGTAPLHISGGSPACGHWFPNEQAPTHGTGAVEVLSREIRRDSQGTNPGFPVAKEYPAVRTPDRGAGVDTQNPAGQTACVLLLTATPSMLPVIENGVSPLSPPVQGLHQSGVS